MKTIKMSLIILVCLSLHSIVFGATIHVAEGKMDVRYV